ncbi:MAG: hypothetical protein ACE145_10335 [Terriglobia bacterium]
MWLFTRFGFFSVVAHNSQPRHLLVRARMPGDLEALKAGYLAELGPIAETPDHDYRFRASVEGDAFAAAVGRVASDISYTNFKDEVHRVQGAQRAGWYAEVWSILSEMQDRHMTRKENPNGKE